MTLSPIQCLVTGGTGFVGRAVLSKINSDPAYEVCVALRQKGATFPSEIKRLQVGSLTPDTDWSIAVRDVNIILHAASQVNMVKEGSNESVAEFYRVNVEGTLNLAQQAANAGVKRFIFISSIKVNGEGKSLNKLYTEEDMPEPVDTYGISKRDAEIGLRKLADETGMEVVIIRPPLVYGPGVKGNFLSMMRWLGRGIPLPFGAINNKRSLVALDNLIDLIVTCMEHPAAANQTFIAGDGEDLSTTELLQRLGKALGRPARLIPVPDLLLRVAATFLGKADVAQRLLGSLQVDISKARDLLGWTPPVSVDDALKKTAQYYLEHQKK